MLCATVSAPRRPADLPGPRFASSFLFALILAFPLLSWAAPSLSVTPITWNVVGLDSNDVNVGPSNFPVGARVCNTGSAATNVTATFNWDAGGTDNGAYINLRSGSLSSITIPSLADGTAASPSCHDFYFETSVTRNVAAYDKARRYHIEVTSSETGGTIYSTPTPREIYVEHLISQNRNSTNNVSYKPLGAGSFTSVAAGGTLSLQVGGSYTIMLDASTATQGYNQLEDFINFPNTIFQVLAVRSTYSANSSAYVANTSDELYADACLWDMDPNSATYLSCIGGDGKTGGTISTEYDVQIIGGAGTTQNLGTLIYDFSGSSFHYNSDFSSQRRLAAITSPLGLGKSFSPVSIAPGGTSTLTLTIANSSGTAVSGIDLTDNLPAGLTISGTPAASQCGGTVSSTSGSLTLTGGSLAASGSCTVTATVTASSTGTYRNTTDSLTIVDATTGVTSDTGITASANLIVETAPSGSCTPVTIANWTISGSTVPPTVTTKDGSVTALASANGTTNITSGYWRLTDASVNSGNTNPISLTTDMYYRFQIGTGAYTNVKMTFTYLDGSTGPQHLDLYYGNSIANLAGLTLFGQYVPSTTATTQTNLDFTNKTNTGGDTYFFLYPYNASNSGGNAWIGIKDITFTGCKPAASLAKSFSPGTVGVGQTSTLTFTLTNTSGSAATPASFTDTLPAGMTVAADATVSQCGGTVTATQNSSVITFTNGSVPANSQCTVTVAVKASAAGSYLNTSGYLSVDGTVINSQASATLLALAPPVISKSFAPSAIYSGSSGASPTTSTLTFNISNPNLSAGMDLTGISFTDSLPANLTAGTTTTTCPGGVVSGSNASTIVLTGASLPAGGACTVTAPITSNSVGSYTNTVTVSSGNGGTGNTSSSALVVQTVHPGISLLKQVSTSPAGPWASTAYVAPGGNVYYRITIENIGDVPLSPVSATDPTLDISSCIWPATLPVGTATIDPTAKCTIGPLTAASSGSVANTASAHGTYNSTVYDSATTTLTTATYNVTDLLISKVATSGSPFFAAGDTIQYQFTVTNSGAPLAGPVTVTDTNSIVSCPGGGLATGASMVCTSTYIVTAFDLSVGSVSNSAYATANGARSNIDRVTVYQNSPDLVVAKSNSVGGYATTGSSFSWTLTVANQGPVDAGFASGQTIVSDQLPPSGATYGAPTAGSFTNITNSGNISCAIDGSKLLTCSASGGSVTLGGTTGRFDVVVPVTPTTAGSLVNAAATADPGNVIAESAEGNNTGADVVTVTGAAAPSLVLTKSSGGGSVTAGGTATYTMTVANNGTAPSSGTVTLVDVLPSGMSVADGSLSLGGADAASWSCTSASNVITCSSTAVVAASSTSVFSFVASVAGGASGSLTNQAQVGGGGDPANPGAPTSTTAGQCTAADTPNKGCAINAVTAIAVADLSITKTDGVTTATPGGSVTYSITVSNAGPSDATGATVADTLPATLTGTWTCVGAGGGTCTASGSGNIGDTVNLPAGGSVTYTVFATISGSASGTLTNTATVTAPGGVTDPSPGNDSATDTDTVGTVSAVADLAITKTDGVTSVSAGGAATYTITLTNNGPDEVSGATVTDTAPAGMAIGGWSCAVSIAGSGGTVTTACGAASGNGNISQSVTMKPGAVIVYSVPVTIAGSASGSLANTATVTVPGGMVDPTPANNSATDLDTVVVATAAPIPTLSSVALLLLAGGMFLLAVAGRLNRVRD